ncbi:hypothetical protein PsYK624_153050 [Phanerochaete sordida]|uniref:Uncharacterized protein n=1 Tax=Phanerochaete sordida TaxID=48140 RepID=A0A9P3GP33_9APHY|nr:hypothetical protein PsYK624_153050 [Phanerochaete sordida]
MLSNAPSTSTVPSLKDSALDTHAQHAHELFTQSASLNSGAASLGSGDAQDAREAGAGAGYECARGDVVSEWREGKDKVVEIQRAPGEDVEVLVIKNAFGGAKARRTRSPPGAAAFVGRCRQAVLHAEQAVRGSVHARPRDAGRACDAKPFEPKRAEGGGEQEPAR